MACEKPLGGGEVDAAVGRRAPLVAACLQQLVDHRPIDTLQRELTPEGDLATRTRSITRLDPGPGEGRIVEHPELGQPLDRRFDEIAPVAGLTQAPPDFDDGSCPDLEEACGRLQHDSGVVDLGSPLSPLRGRFPM